jgi:hypothetical protein
MALSEIKDEYKNKVIAFGRQKGAIPIGQRTDIDDLAVIALESQDRSLLRLFKKLPDLSELKKQKTDAAIQEAQIKKQVSDSKKAAIASTKGVKAKIK